MSRRQRQRDDSSLELLLDTITNTFGGILFIAILLSLLLRSRSQATGEIKQQSEPMSAVERAALETRVMDLQQEAAVLRQRLASVSQPSDAEADVSSLDKLSSAAAALEAAVAERAESVRNTIDSQKSAFDATQQLESLENDKQSAKRRLADAEQRLAAAQAEAARLAEVALQIDRPPGATEIEQTVSLPSLRPSMKREVGLYVRFDKVFMMHAWKNGERMGPNTNQFVIVQLPAGEGVRQVARPKPAAGMPVTEKSIDTDMRSLLQPFSKDHFVVSMVVFEDSFDVFQLIKAAVVKHGYEYRPIALQQGESVVDSGGRGEAQ